MDGEQTPVAVTHAEVRNHDALAQHLVYDTQGLEGLERPRVYDGCPRVTRRTSGPIEHYGLDPVRSEQAGYRQPGRAGPNHSDFYLIGDRLGFSTHGTYR
jgi:hypothetical protein